MDNQLDQAKKYHDMGLNTIPLRIPGEIHNDKTSAGKDPRVKIRPYFHRPQTAGELQKIFTLAEQNNIGIVAGICSKNLVVLDFDSRQKYMELYAKNPFFRWIADNTIITKSYRGVHVWIRTDVPAKIGKNKELALDIKGQNSYTVEPNSIYRRDQQIGNYLFEQFNEILTLPIDQLEFLGVTPAPHVDHHWLDLGFKHFSILQGDKAGYKSRSEAESAFVLKQISNGERFEYVLELFQRLAADNTHFRDHTDPVEYLKTTYQNATTVYAKKQRRFDKNIIKAMHNIEDLDFRTYSDPSVLQAILQKARETGKLYLDLSVRTLAEDANVSTRTVSNSLKRLEETGFIHKELNGYYDHAARFAVNVESICQNLHTPAQPLSGMVCVEIDIKVPENPRRTIGNDAYAWGGLNKTGFKVVSFLNERVGEGLSVAQIVAGAGISRNTVVTKLKDLGKLIETKKQGRSILHSLPRKIIETDLEQIARTKGTAGRKDRLKQQHARERVDYQTRLAQQKDISKWTEETA